MFGTIVVTTIINWLIVAVLHYWARLKHSEEESQQLRKENSSMNDWIQNRETSDQEERVRRSYNRGLYDGRQTDTLYRQTLKRYQNGEQIAIVMSGHETAEERQCNGRDLG